MRTTSSMESLNAALRRIFPNHPHIYKFMECLQLHEFSKSVDMIEAVKTEASIKQLERRKKVDQRREEKIRKLTVLLKTDPNMSPGRFLESMATKGDSFTEMFESSKI